jgi:hypothetical protein
LDERCNGFAAVWRGSRIAQPGRSGIRLVSVDLVEGSPCPTTIVAVAQPRLDLRIESESLGCLPCSLLRARPAPACLGQTIGKRFDVLRAEFIEWLIRWEFYGPHGLG